MKSWTWTLFPIFFSGWAGASTPSPHLDYSLTPDRIQQECRSVKEKAERRYGELASLPAAEKTFRNTPGLFEEIGSDLGDEATSPTFPKYVSTDKKVRDAAHDCETLLEQFGVEIYSREDLYGALKAYAARGEPLQGEDKKLLEKTLLDFRRNGMELDPKGRKRVQKLKKKLVRLEGEFGKNLNEVKDYLAVAPAELEGLPEDFVKRLDKAEGGKLKVTLDYPDYFPFMRNAKSVEARKKLEQKFNNRAASANGRLLKKVLKLRREVSEALGYPTYAHYIQEDRMAKNPSNVNGFLSRLQKRLKEKADQELRVMGELKKKEEGPAADPRIYMWDFAYYNNLLKKTKYELDDEKVKEYFPMEVVTEGMLRIYQKVLGLTFREVKPTDTWHPDAQLFEVVDAGTGERVGHFYMDLFPREGKYKHAAAFTLIQGRKLPDGSYQKPVSAIVANFNKPTADRPSLLKHDEVETFFHEFGHIMHQVLTKARYGRFAGTSVARDFVEAPSQMMENWVWSADTLKGLSGHYKNKAHKIPDGLVKRMIEVKNLNSGLRYLRQAFYALVDMEYHTRGVEDTTEVYGRLQEEIALIPMSPGTRPEASFGHLMGYAAAYYGYLWSEVYAQDMFTRFEKGGLLNDRVGREYRQLILEPGRSRDEGGQIRKFLGRDPNEDAFLRNIGLGASSGPRP